MDRWRWIWVWDCWGKRVIWPTLNTKYKIRIIQRASCLIFFIQELFKGKLLQFVLVPHTTPQSRTQTFSKIYDRLASDDEQFSVRRLKHSLFLSWYTTVHFLFPILRLKISNFLKQEFFFFGRWAMI